MSEVKKIIEIQVRGDVGSGKTEVLEVIRRALKAHYGPHAQIASYDLSTECGSDSDLLGVAKKTGQCCHQSDTVFILGETNSGAFQRKP